MLSLTDKVMEISNTLWTHVAAKMYAVFFLLFVLVNLCSVQNTGMCFAGRAKYSTWWRRTIGVIVLLQTQ